MKRRLGENRKNKKNNIVCLKKFYLRFILMALFAGIGVFAGEPADAKSLKTEKKPDGLQEKIRQLSEENRQLKEEKTVIRRELLETLDKNTMLTEKLKRMELSVAALTESLEPVYTGAREEESVESLRTVMQSSAALASATEQLCAEVLLLLEKEKIDPVCAAKLRLKVNSSRALIRRIAILNSPAASPGGVHTCRVLNIDHSLNAAAVSAGYRNGIRNGMLLYSSDGSVVLRIVAVRSFTSAGIVSSGKVSDLVIGMELSSRVEKSVKRK